MEHQLNEKVESILTNIRPSLGGADIRLKDISQGVVINVAVVNWSARQSIVQW